MIETTQFSLKIMQIIIIDIMRTEKKPAPDLRASNFLKATAGIRPFRSTGIRLEAQEVQGKKIVHNYGHGGAGISLAPATAKEAIQLIQRMNFPKNSQIAILGSGINGLLTALECSKHGYQVKVYAKRIPVFKEKDTSKMCTSEVAPGYWLPYHYNFSDKKKHDERVCSAFQQYRLWEGRSSFVNWIDVFESISMQEVKENLPPQLLGNVQTVFLQVGFQQLERVKFKTYQIDLEGFLQQILIQCKNRGINFQESTFSSVKDIVNLPQKVMVNCLGMSNKYLLGDENLYGVKGTLLHFKNTTNLRGIYSFQIQGQPLKLYAFADKIIVGITKETSMDEKVNPEIARELKERAEKFTQIYGTPTAKL